MTTEQAKTEVVHDTLVDVRTIVVHDTVRETQTVTLVLNADSTERSRTTERTREHTRSSAATAETKSVLESEMQSQERTEDKQATAAVGGENQLSTRWKRLKAFHWGVLTGLVLTTAATIFVRLRKRYKLWREQ